jgi:hydrogenase nickel incorporation protein HypA/HybF
MHEYSIMSQVVKTILEEGEKNRLRSISSVYLEVGELSFLSEESLRFCFSTLVENNILSNSELIIQKIKPEVECGNCGYTGELEYLEKDEFHFRLPQFACPKCDGVVKITKGKGCVIKEITGETDD